MAKANVIGHVIISDRVAFTAGPARKAALFTPSSLVEDL